MRVRFKKLDPRAKAPYKAHPSDAGYDLYATSREIDEFGNVVYGTGLAVEIPEGYAGLLFPRSSVCKTDLALSNAVGLIDPHFRGEIKAKFKAAAEALELVSWSPDGLDAKGAVSDSLTLYEVGDRIAQLVIMPIPEIEFTEAEELSQTDRGEGGYGSTGK